MIRNEHLLWYRQPAADWLEALPIGNGRLGGMVFGGVARERIALNEDTLWSGYPQDKNNPHALEHLAEARELIAAGRVMEAQELIASKMLGPFGEAYQPLGDLLIDFGKANAGGSKMTRDGDEFAYKDYRRELDLSTGIASTRFTIDGKIFTRECFASAPDGVMVMRLACDAPGAVSLELRLDSALRHACAVEGADSVMLWGRAPMHINAHCAAGENPIYYDEIEDLRSRDAKGIRFATAARVMAEGGVVEAQGESIRVMNAEAVTIILAAATSFDGPGKIAGSSDKDPEAHCRQTLAKAASSTYDELRARHVKDHARLFERVELELPANANSDIPTDERLAAFGADPSDQALLSLILQFGRYLLIAASRPGSQPTNLQGIWNKEVVPPWCSNYTININTEMNYWLAETCNLSECHQPLFGLIDDLKTNGVETARAHYGCSGWTSHHNTDLWRFTNPVAGNPQWAFWPMSGAWLCRHLWEHYEFTKDEKFLAQRAWPAMKGAAEFVLDWLIEGSDGYLVTNPSTSPENSYIDPAAGQPCTVSMATTMDMAICWDLLTHCRETTEILRVDREFGKRCKEARDRLRPMRIGAKGQLQEWYQDFEDTDPHHRHMSHLYGCYPGHQITGETPELMGAVRRTMELRTDVSTGWSMAWKVNLWARLGDGGRAHQVLRNFLHPIGATGATNYHSGGIYPNLFCAHPPFQIDGNYGAAAGIAEMLVQSHDGLITLLPALPEAWPEGRVKGLKARGGIELDIAWREGRLLYANLRARLGGACRMRVSGKEIEFDTKPGGRYRIGDDARVEKKKG